MGEMANYLVSNYGKQVDKILENFIEMKGQEPERSDINLGLAELNFALKHEFTFTLLDFFERRTGRLYFNIDSIDRLKEPIAARMASYHGWSQKTLDLELAKLENAIKRSSKFL